MCRSNEIHETKVKDLEFKIISEDDVERTEVIVD
jgi:hypothetical protein